MSSLQFLVAIVQGQTLMTCLQRVAGKRHVAAGARELQPRPELDQPYDQDS